MKPSYYHVLISTPEHPSWRVYIQYETQQAAERMAHWCNDRGNPHGRRYGWVRKLVNVPVTEQVAYQGRRS